MDDSTGYTFVDGPHWMGDLERKLQESQKLESLGENVSDLPSDEQPPRRRVPWPWIRLAVELSILATAAGWFFGMGPGLKSWRLTGNHRIAPIFQAKNYTR